MSALVVSASAFPVNAQIFKNYNVFISNRASYEEEVTIPDSAIKQALLDNPQIQGGKITKENLAKIASLSVPNRGIKDIEGLQYCTSLAYLDLGYSDGIVDENKGIKNEIESIDQLSGLTSLTHLYLNDNRVLLDCKTTLYETFPHFYLIFVSSEFF